MVDAPRASFFVSASSVCCLQHLRLLRRHVLRPRLRDADHRVLHVHPDLVLQALQHELLLPVGEFVG